MDAICIDKILVQRKPRVVEICMLGVFYNFVLLLHTVSGMKCF